MLPAVGQGALAVQIRSNDDLEGDLRTLDDQITRQAVTAERSFLNAMGGGCRTFLLDWLTKEFSLKTLL